MKGRGGGRNPEEEMNGKRLREQGEEKLEQKSYRLEERFVEQPVEGTEGSGWAEIFEIR